MHVFVRIWLAVDFPDFTFTSLISYRMLRRWVLSNVRLSKGKNKCREPGENKSKHPTTVKKS